jgi:hypothetical protein
MKKLWILVIAICVTFSMAAVAQDMGKSCDMGKSKMSAPLKTWDVMNPEKLKGHEGHHVQVSAHVYADKNSIHVMSVKMLKKQASSM